MGFNSGFKGLKLFLYIWALFFPKMCWPALGPSRLSIQWAQELFLGSVKRPEREIHHTNHLMLRLRMSGFIPLLPYMPWWRGQGHLYPHMIPVILLAGFMSWDTFGGGCPQKCWAVVKRSKVPNCLRGAEENLDSQTEFTCW